jgi:hypothetical protein
MAASGRTHNITFLRTDLQRKVEQQTGCRGSGSAVGVQNGKPTLAWQRCEVRLNFRIMGRHFRVRQWLLP